MFSDLLVDDTGPYVFSGHGGDATADLAEKGMGGRWHAAGATMRPRLGREAVCIWCGTAAESGKGGGAAGTAGTGAARGWRVRDGKASAFRQERLGRERKEGKEKKTKKMKNLCVEIYVSHM